MQNKTIQQLSQEVAKCDGVMSTVKEDGVSCIVLILMSSQQVQHPTEMFQQSVHGIHNEQNTITTSAFVFFPGNLRDVPDNSINNLHAHVLAPKLHDQLQKGVAQLNLQDCIANKSPTAIMLRCECLVPGGGAHSVTSKVVNAKKDESAAHRVCFSILRIIPKYEASAELIQFLQRKQILYKDIQNIMLPWPNVKHIQKLLSQDNYENEKHGQSLRWTKTLLHKMTWPTLDLDFSGNINPKSVFKMPIVWLLSQGQTTEAKIQSFVISSRLSRNKTVIDQEHEGLVVCTWKDNNASCYKLKFRNFNLLAPLLSIGTLTDASAPKGFDSIVTPFIFGLLKWQPFSKKWECNQARQTSINDNKFRQPNNISAQDRLRIKTVLQNNSWWKKIQACTQLGFVTSVASVHMPEAHKVSLKPSIEDMHCFYDQHRQLIFYRDRTLNIFATANVDRGAPNPKGLLRWQTNKDNFVHICNELQEFGLLSTPGQTLYQRITTEQHDSYLHNILHNNMTTVILIWYMSYLLENNYKHILKNYWQCCSRIARQMFSAYVLDSLNQSSAHRFCVAHHPVFAALKVASHSDETRQQQDEFAKMALIYTQAGKHIENMLQNLSTSAFADETHETQAKQIKHIIQIWQQKSNHFLKLAIQHKEDMRHSEKDMRHEEDMRHSVSNCPPWTQPDNQQSSKNSVYTFTQTTFNGHYNLASLLASHRSIKTQRHFVNLTQTGTEYYLFGPLAFDANILTQLKLGVFESNAQNRSMFVNLCVCFDCEERLRGSQKTERMTNNSAHELFNALVQQNRQKRPCSNDGTSSQKRRNCTDQGGTETKNKCAIS